MPVSDDGGSTAEILRLFGGPAIGDVVCILVNQCIVKQSLISLYSDTIVASASTSPCTRHN